MEKQRRPEWLKVRLRTDPNFRRLRKLVDELKLNTVCTEARCPNIYECWNAGTATFMILGETCTRRCGFCSVHSGRPDPGVDKDEPRRVGEAIARLGIRHAVITSVDRDDLPDGGAAHFRDVTNAIRSHAAGCAVELLTPDFKGRVDALDIVLQAPPDVFSHNIETVPRLYKTARPGSKFLGSVALLEASARERDARGLTMRIKSSMMLGLGETDDEVLDVMATLREAGVEVMAMGQYLQPTRDHMPVTRFVSPDHFRRFADAGKAMGFLHVEAGPLVRSSYHAEQHHPALPVISSHSG
ncbi:MAG: lipoyl synthase [Acidobacteriota bacterium]|nr:lipoyl synthase [Acidobacteriota bacterium]